MGMGKYENLLRDIITEFPYSELALMIEQGINSGKIPDRAKVMNLLIAISTRTSDEPEFKYEVSNRLYVMGFIRQLNELGTED
jgi:hypothetical protein